MMRSLASVVLSFVTLLVLPSSAAAQFDSASVVGTIRDASGAAVAGAKVTLTSVQTGISAIKTSAENGSYEFPAVKPGVYLVSAEKNGFTIALVENVQVQVGARLRVDLQLAVGQMTETVEVTASSPLIDTDSSQRGQVISGDQTRALPLLSREYSALAPVADGVLGPATTLVERAHARKLLVHVWTLRSDNDFLPAAYGGDALAEVRRFRELGVDGFFTDFPDVGVRGLADKR